MEIPSAVSSRFSSSLRESSFPQAGTVSTQSIQPPSAKAGSADSASLTTSNFVKQPSHRSTWWREATSAAAGPATLGAVVGASAGGPVGFFLGGALGFLVGAGIKVASNLEIGPRPNAPSTPHKFKEYVKPVLLGGATGAILAALGAAPAVTIPAMLVTGLFTGFGYKKVVDANLAPA